MTDITTISVVVAITTPSRVRKERSLCVRNASSAIQKASREVTQTPVAPTRWGAQLVEKHLRLADVQPPDLLLPATL